MNKNAAEIIGYQIFITKEDFELAIKSDQTRALFWLAWILRTAEARYIINKEHVENV